MIRPKVTRERGSQWQVCDLWALVSQQPHSRFRPAVIWAWASL